MDPSTPCRGTPSFPKTSLLWGIGLLASGQRTSRSRPSCGPSRNQHIILSKDADFTFLPLIVLKFKNEYQKITLNYRKRFPSNSVLSCPSPLIWFNLYCCTCLIHFLIIFSQSVFFHIFVFSTLFYLDLLNSCLLFHFFNLILFHLFQSHLVSTFFVWFRVSAGFILFHLIQSHPILSCFLYHPVSFSLCVPFCLQFHQIFSHPVSFVLFHSM